MIKKLLFLIIPVFIFAAILFINVDDLENIQEKIIINISLDKCDAQNKKCIVNIKGLKLDILLDENIYYLKPFNVSVRVNQGNVLEIKSIQIDFKMKKMKMGVNRFMLKNTKEQTWQGKALLPICVTGRIDWSSELEIDTKNYKYILSFPIIVKKQ